jgi:zinc protease
MRPAKRMLTGAALAVAALSTLPRLGSANPPTGLTFPSLSFKLPKAEVKTLPNGMKLYLLEDPELPLVEASAYIRTGAVYVPAEKTGLAGLFGATQRAGGTRSRTPEQINQALDQIAASVETSVSSEYATASLSVMKRDLDTGLAIFADVLMNPEFRQEQVDLQKAQAIEGIRRRNDDPNAVAFREFNKRLYGPDHPYGREPTIESVSALTRNDLIAFHQKYYHPNNLMLAVSGDFRKDDLIRRLDKAFAGWKQEKVTLPPVPPVKRDEKRAVYYIQKAIPQSSIVIGQLGVSRHDPDRIPLEVMNYILGGAGFTSRLVREVRSNRGLAYTVGSLFTINAQAGSLGAFSFTRADATTQATSLMLEILEQIRTNPVSPDELRDAQQSLVNSFVFRFDDSHQVVVQQMVYDYFAYPAGWLENYPKRVQAVTREDLLSVARKHLHPDQAIVLVVGDREKFDGPLSKFGAVQTITLTDAGTAARP